MKKIDLSAVAVDCTRRTIRHRSMGPATARLASGWAPGPGALWRHSDHDSARRLVQPASLAQP
jgi:hypothetical protein